MQEIDFIAEFDQDLEEDLFDTNEAIAVDVDPTAEDNQDVGPDVIFLGREPKKLEHEDPTLEEVIAESFSSPEHRLEDDFRNIMNWFENEQRQIKLETTSFVRAHQGLLEEHKAAMEVLMLEQRRELEDIIEKMPRSPSSSIESYSDQHHETVQFVFDQGDDTDHLSDFSSPPARASHLAVNTAKRISQSLQQIGVKFRNSVTEIGAPARLSSSSRTSFEDKALRIQLAYQDAAKKMRGKSTFTRFQERFEHVSKPQISLMTRLFGWRFPLHTIEGRYFQSFIASLIVLNALFIGLTSDMSIKRSFDSYEIRSSSNVAFENTMPDWTIAVEFGFNIAFITELAFRIVVLESRFCAGPDWRWNFFDAVLVCLCITEMSLLGFGFNPSFMRVLRVMRVSRSLRMLRLMRFTHLVRKLRLMTVAIINCSMMLMWAVLVLLLVTFLFSVVFLGATAQYVTEAVPGNEYVDDMNTYFHSLFMTMITLFMAVTGGVDWWDVMRLFMEIHAAYGILFMVFVVITVLAVLNVINAIFVNDAMESTRTDHDLRMQGELEDARFMLERLTDIFETMQSNPDGSGEISYKSFIEQVEREEMKMQFALLGLYYTDGFNFFRLLDVDANKTLGIDQFVMGCLRLRGGALLIDTNILLEDTKSLVSTTSRSHDRSIDLLTQQLKHVCEKLGDRETDKVSISDRLPLMARQKTGVVVRA